MLLGRENRRAAGMTEAGSPGLNLGRVQSRIDGYFAPKTQINQFCPQACIVHTPGMGSVHTPGLETVWNAFTHLVRRCGRWSDANTPA